MKRLITLVPAAVLLAVYVLSLILFPSKPVLDPELAAWNVPSEFPDRLMKYHFDIRTADGADGPTYEVSYKVNELNRARALKKGASVQRDWVSRGPGNIGGRTRELVIDPGDATGNTWFAGSVGGGIWKTTNAGQSWTNLTPDLPNLATSTLAMAMSNPNVIYAGTGEGFANSDAIAGDGMWKSTDRGQSWTQLAATVGPAAFRFVNRIIVDPGNENILIVAAQHSILRSTDGGTSFTEVFTGTDGGFNVGEIQQVIATPGNFSVQYAAVNGQGIFKSTNAGVAWSHVCVDAVIPGRLELAVSPVDPNWIYAGVDGSRSTLYVSSDAGATCALVADETLEPDWLGAQGWYDNTIAAHPFDVRKVIVGGINLWQIDLKEETVVQEGLIGMNTDETSSFLSFVSFTDNALQGLGLGPDEDAVDLVEDDFVTVEIRWGPGRSQKAHRFTVPEGATSGVPPNSYTYQNYVDVPFEAWDIDNNRQLMVSFRDQQADGQFNLLNETGQGREYVFINAIPYDGSGPNSDIVRAGGQTQKLIYFLWHISTGTWDPGSIPTSKVTVKWGLQTVLLSSSNQISQFNPPSGLHVDMHGLFITNVNEGAGTFRIVSTNDGGVGLSEDGGGNWQMRVGEYVTTQFYGADRHPDEKIYIGGTQDNSTLRSPAGSQSGSSWATEIGGDGFEVVWNGADPSQVLGSSQFNNIFKSTSSGKFFVAATNGMTDVGSGTGGVFVVRLAKSRIDEDLVFAIGQSGVWRTDDFAENWTLAPIPGADWKNENDEGDVTISEANAQVVWAGSGVTTSQKRRLHLSTDGGISFSPVDVLNNDIGFITGIATHPTDENTAYVLFSVQGAPKILRTTDLGQSWEDISGFTGKNESDNGFPDVATYSLLVMPHNPNEIWAGTEIGLFISEDNGATWAFADDGLPAVSVWQMQVIGDEIVVASHGRGIWSVTDSDLLSAPPPDIAVAPRLLNADWVVTGSVAMVLDLRTAFDSTQVTANGVRIGSIGTTEPGLRAISIRYDPGSIKDIVVQAVSYQNGKPFHSPTAAMTAFPRPARVGEYVNEFDRTADADDFAGDGFSVKREEGLGWLITASPYPSDANMTFTLVTPIQVSDVNPMMNWSDVAMVQPGLPGFDWTQAQFRDYVVVEASTNGLTWTNLGDGYDASFDPIWRALYPTGGIPGRNLLRDHSINLLNFYDVGQIIFIRFRLFSDASNEGAGWFIDRLEIQLGSPVANESESDIPTEFALHANYPNPFNPSTNIRFAVPELSDVSVRIFDVNGRLVETLTKGLLAAGNHSVTWDARDLASGTYFYRLEAGTFVETRKMLLVR